jgi:hypothetical protein
MNALANRGVASDVVGYTTFGGAPSQDDVCVKVYDGYVPFGGGNWGDGDSGEGNVFAGAYLEGAYREGTHRGWLVVLPEKPDNARA